MLIAATAPHTSPLTSNRTANTSRKKPRRDLSSRCRRILATSSVPVKICGIFTSSGSSGITMALEKARLNRLDTCLTPTIAHLFRRGCSRRTKLLHGDGSDQIPNRGGFERGCAGEKGGDDT